jgi:hypothetical protein
VHANLIAGMLDGAIKHKPDYLLAADVLQALLAGLVMIFLAPRLSPFKTTLLGIGVLGALAGLNFVLWHDNVVLPFAGAALLVALLYALDMSWGYFVEAKTKRQFAELFGQYVPPELVDEMAKNPEGYSMAGRKVELTVLFSDVRGFTTISEGLQPDELEHLMNEYLGAMTAVIRRRRAPDDRRHRQHHGDLYHDLWFCHVFPAKRFQEAAGLFHHHPIGLYLFRPFAFCIWFWLGVQWGGDAYLQPRFCQRSVLPGGWRAQLHYRHPHVALAARRDGADAGGRR